MAEIPFSFQGLPACEMSTPLKFHSSTHENYRPKPGNDLFFQGRAVKLRGSISWIWSARRCLIFLCRHVHRDGFGTVPLPFFKLPAHNSLLIFVLIYNFPSKHTFFTSHFYSQNNPPPNKKKKRKGGHKKLNPPRFKRSRPRPRRPWRTEFRGSPVLKNRWLSLRSKSHLGLATLPWLDSAVDGLEGLTTKSGVKFHRDRKHDQNPTKR